MATSFYGSAFGGNPRYVVERLLEVAPNVDVVWLARGDVVQALPAGVRAVRYGSWRAAIELATARVWIDDSRKKFGPRKRKGQYYLQTWHGDIAMKKVEKDAEVSLDPAYIFYAQCDSVDADAITSGSLWSARLYEDSFWMTGKVLLSGTARTDIFFGDRVGVAEHVRQQLGIAAAAKILLYAPTFRAGRSDVSIGSILDELVVAASKRWPGAWVAALRLHPNEQHLRAETASDVFDASGYPDMQELICAADLVVTDYSSLMFDALIARKPCVLFVPDLDEYASQERGVYFMPSDLPFPFSSDITALAELVQNFDDDIYSLASSKFLAEVGSVEDGHAAERIVELLMGPLGTQQ